MGIIGAGRIGGSLVARLSATKGFDLTVSDADEERLAGFAGAFGVRITPSNKEAADASDLIVVAVKPWDVGPVLEEVSPVVEGKAVVSVAAGLPISGIAERLPEGAAILRVMPNVCAAVGLGNAVVAANGPGEAYLPAVMDIFRHVGDVIEIPEGLFDGTARFGTGVRSALRGRPGAGGC